MKRFIVIFSLLGCLWGSLLGVAFLQEEVDVDNLPSFLCKPDPKLIQEARSKGYQLIVDSRKKRLGVVVTDETLNQIQKKNEEERCRQRIDNSHSYRYNLIEEPAVGEVSYSLIGNQYRSDFVPQWTVYAFFVILGAVCGFLSHLLPILSIYGLSKLIRNKCNSIQIYLCAVFIPLIAGVPIMITTLEDSDYSYFWIIYIVLVFIFEFMLFASRSTEQKRATQPDVQFQATTGNSSAKNAPPPPVGGYSYPPDRDPYRKKYDDPNIMTMLMTCTTLVGCSREDIFQYDDVKFLNYAGAVYVVCLSFIAQTEFKGDIKEILAVLEDFFVDLFKIPLADGSAWFMSIATKWAGPNKIYGVESRKIEHAFKRLKHWGSTDEFFNGMASEVKSVVDEMSSGLYDDYRVRT